MHMHPPTPGICRSVRLLMLTLAMCATAAFADDYTPVNTLVREGRLADAMVQADAYLAKNPRDPQMRFLKGLIQQDSGKVPEAIATYTSLTQEYPELPEPYNNVAVLYAGQGQFDKARVALEMATRASRSYATAHENLGDVYARLAVQSYSTAQQLDGRNTTVAPKLALIRQLFTVPTAARSVAPRQPASAASAAR